MVTRLVMIIGITVLFALSGVPSAAAEQVAGISVDFGVSSGMPVFVLSNLAPGALVTRTIGITNTGSMPRIVRIRGTVRSESHNLSSALRITVRNQGAVIYGDPSAGGNTLKQFLTTENGSESLPHVQLPPGTVQRVQIDIRFEKQAGNQYQDALLVMDLPVDASDEIPAACRGIMLKGATIYGTNRADRLHGTAGNDIIMTLDGNDRIDGGGGDDCIVNGRGHKIVNGGAGDDVVIGGPDSEYLMGGIGNDVLIGNGGFDVLNGGNGTDRCVGEIRLRCEK